MFRRGHRTWIGLLLVPALWAFTLQSALEVFHPIEERRTSVHDHGGEGDVVFDSSECAPNPHDRHFCSHSGAHARLLHLTATFEIGSQGVARLALPEAFPAPQLLDLSGRGPPSLV